MDFACFRSGLELGCRRDRRTMCCGILPPYRVNPVTLLDTVIVILFVVLAGFLLVKSAIVVSLIYSPYWILIDLLQLYSICCKAPAVHPVILPAMPV